MGGVVTPRNRKRGGMDKKGKEDYGKDIGRHTTCVGE
mgnify:FL=1|jgi:hypothetical protein